jgi:hypothetical protein
VYFLSLGRSLIVGANVDLSSARATLSVARINAARAGLGYEQVETLTVTNGSANGSNGLPNGANGSANGANGASGQAVSDQENGAAAPQGNGTSW